MKLFSASILASAASAVMGLTPAQLETRWDMDTPDIEYFSDQNKFVLDFPTASLQNTVEEGMQEEFYDVNCKDDGSGFPEKVLFGIFSDPNNPSLRPQMRIGNTNTALGIAGNVQLEFVIDTQAAAADSSIYEIVGNSDNCIGQLYDISIDIAVDYPDVTENYIEISEEDDPDNNVFSYNAAFVPGMNKINVPDLCRGKDYIFKFLDTGFDGLTIPYDNEGVVGSYNSSGTPDVIFQKSGGEIGGGFQSRFNLPLNPQNPATNVQGKDGQGMMKFCVRSSLGYGGKIDQSLSLFHQIAEDYQEVNFIESLITIFFDMTAGFSVLSFNVDPKERVETTAVKDAYGLEAWLCDTTQTVTTEFPNDIDKTVPAPIDESYLQGAPASAGNPTYFNQGALITVCVAPDDAAWQDGIRMNGINTFDWLRSDLGTTAQSLADTSNINQEAIVLINGEGAGSPNGLTSYTASNCLGGEHYCTFSSILFADFYVSRGVASGLGTANLIFAAPGGRRLGAPEDEVTDRNRKLQEDEAAESPFDVSVPVDLTDTGPAGLKTAGGASYGITALASALALLGAALLA